MFYQFTLKLLKNCFFSAEIKLLYVLYMMLLIYYVKIKQMVQNSTFIFSNLFHSIRATAANKKNNFIYAEK